MTRPSLGRLFLTFLVLGSYAFGGPAIVVYIKELVVRRHQWLDEASFAEGVALCQSLPGPISMDVAAFAGLKARGITGALLAYLGLGLPAAILVAGLSHLYARYHGVPQVVSMLAGLQVIIVAIVVNAAASFSRSTIKDYRDLLIVLATTLLFGEGVSPFLVIAAGLLGGIVLFREVPGRPSESSGGCDLPVLKKVAGITALLCCAMIFLVCTRPELGELAAVMLKTDLFAFGGGFGALPLMLHQVVDVKGWLDARTFMDGIALGQITPGPVIITATFVGYMLYGYAGALVSTVAVLTPSFLLVLVAVPLFDKLKGSSSFARAVRGILAVFVGLLLFVAIKFALSIHWNTVTIPFGIAALVSLVRKVPIFYVVLAGALLSLLLFK